jgi:menaquinone-dependent protoporphyrinogen oxidase
MMGVNVLVAYHSEEGQTAKVAARVAEVLRAGGADVQLTEVSAAPGPAGFDAVVLGDSIHAGRHSPQLRHYISEHAIELNRAACALFQVSLTSARRDAEHAAEARALLKELQQETGLVPQSVGLFGGALAYSRYNWFKRRLMRTVSRRDGGDTDTTRDYEYTDWDDVDHFAEQVLSSARAASAREP